jgi:hypothetical protein
VSDLTRILDQLLRAIAWRDGVVTEVYSEYGPAADVSAGAREQFKNLVRSAIDELTTELGPTVGAETAGASGIDPETILGDPPFDNPPSVILAFAVWRHRDLWVFVVGRFCRSAAMSHFIILLGATSQSTADAQAMIA